MQGTKAEASARAACPSMCEGPKAGGWAKAKTTDCNTVVYISVWMGIGQVTQRYTSATRGILYAGLVYIDLLQFIVFVA